MRHLIQAFICTLTLWLNTAAASPTTLQLSQIFAEAPEIAAYLAVRDEADAPVSDITAEHLQATLGAHSANVSALTPFSETNEGVSYLFAVDISRSIVGERFEQLKTALREWIDALQAPDQAGIITFGEAVKTLIAPTADRDALRAAIDRLAPTDQQTQLHAALLRGLSLSQQRIEGLPARRALILLSDGLNDDPGGVTADEVLARMAEEPVPIYGIFFSGLRDRAQREAGLATLGGFARRSGGQLIDAGSGDPAAALAAARERIRQVYRAALDCPACVWDGNRYRLQLTWSADGLTLSDGMDVRLYPAAAISASTETDPAEAGTDEAGDGVEDEDDRAESIQAPLEGDADEPADSEGAAEALNVESEAARSPLPSWWPWAAAGGGLILLLLLLLLLRVLGQRRSAAKHLQEEVPVPDPSASALDQAAPETVRYPEPRDDLEPQTQQPTVSRAPTAAPTHRLYLTGMSRAIKGQVSEIDLPPTALLGRRADCTLALPQDDLISGRHAELRLQNQRMLIADLGSTNQTFVNGVAIQAPHPLVEGDLLRFGQSEFRVQMVRLDPSRGTH